MNKIEKIQAKIDRMLDDICEADGFVQKKDEPRYDALAEVLDFIDALEEQPDNSLDEAAEEYQSDARRHVLDDTPIGTAKDAFIAGAKWQEERDGETIKTAEDHAFLAGADWQYQKIQGELHKIKAKAWGEGFNTHDQLVMKEAVEADVADLNGDIYNYCIEKGMTDEDKVKLIIIKED